MKSIQHYLRSRIIGGSAAILVVGSVLIAVAIRHLDILEFDAALENKARTLDALVLHALTETNGADSFMPELDTAEKAEFFQFRRRDGSLILRSNSLGGHDLPFLPDAETATVFQNVLLPNGRPGRFVQIIVRPPKAGTQVSIREGDKVHNQVADAYDTADAVLAVAQSREELNELLWSVYIALATVDLVLVGMIAFLVCKALRTGLQPLADLHAQIARFGPDTLSHRIHLPDAPAEIAILPATVNASIEALEAMFERERQFTSDVAHELRTPVAEFRAACEVGAKWADDPALVRRRFENLRESAGNMERMLTELLDMSRLDKGAVHLQMKTTLIAALLDTCWTRIGGVGGGRLENRIDRSLSLDTDPDILEQILFNLLHNAASYGLCDAPILCESEATPSGTWVLRISNRTEALEVGDVRHVFERFWRKDAARTGGQGYGLGLAIVRALATALELRVSADLSPEGVFTVSLSGNKRATKASFSPSS